MPIQEGKRSTLVRDIGIGVGIAAFVLIGFLVVKMFVLDSDSKSGGGGAQPTSKFATVKLAMPAGVAAEMFVDGERIATVTSESPGIPISAGTKHIKLVGTNGLTCDDPKVKLEAGKTTTLECNFGLTGSGSAATPAGSAAAQMPQGGSAEVKTVDTHAGSAEGKPADARGSGAQTDIKSSETKKPADPKSGDLKLGDTKTGETKPADTKVTETKKPADTKVGETKATETKATDTKHGDTVVKTTDKKPADTKPPLDTKAAAVDPTKGYLQVFSKPPAKILVDMNDTGMKTPISGQTLALPPGKHKITFVIGDDRFTYPVMIKAGVTDTMSKDLQ
jgi:hypothetical protein